MTSPIYVFFDPSLNRPPVLLSSLTFEPKKSSTPLKKVSFASTVTTTSFTENNNTSVTLRRTSAVSPKTPPKTVKPARTSLRIIPNPTSTMAKLSFDHVDKNFDSLKRIKDKASLTDDDFQELHKVALEFWKANKKGCEPKPRLWQKEIWKKIADDFVVTANIPEMYTSAREGFVEGESLIWPEDKIDITFLAFCTLKWEIRNQTSSYKIAKRNARGNPETEAASTPKAKKAKTSKDQSAGTLVDPEGEEDDEDEEMGDDDDENEDGEATPAKATPAKEILAKKTPVKKNSSATAPTSKTPASETLASQATTSAPVALDVDDDEETGSDDELLETEGTPSHICKRGRPARKPSPRVVKQGKHEAKTKDKVLDLIAQVDAAERKLKETIAADKEFDDARVHLDEAVESDDDAAGEGTGNNFGANNDGEDVDMAGKDEGKGEESPSPSIEDDSVEATAATSTSEASAIKATTKKDARSSRAEKNRAATDSEDDSDTAPTTNASQAKKDSVKPTTPKAAKGNTTRDSPKASKESKAEKAKADKEAKAEKAKVEKEAKVEHAKAEKEAKAEKAKAEKEVKAQNAKAEKQAKAEKAKADKAKAKKDSKDEEGDGKGTKNHAKANEGKKTTPKKPKEVLSPASATERDDPAGQATPPQASEVTSIFGPNNMSATASEELGTEETSSQEPSAIKYRVKSGLHPESPVDLSLPSTAAFHTVLFQALAGANGEVSAGIATSKLCRVISPDGNYTSFGWKKEDCEVKWKEAVGMALRDVGKGKGHEGEEVQLHMVGDEQP